MPSTLGAYMVEARAEARSPRLDAKGGGGRKPGLDSQHPRSSRRGTRLRIPGRNQVNRDQAFIIVSSLWPFRRWRRSSQSVRAVRAPRKG
jgi:hypothetical protein